MPVTRTLNPLPFNDLDPRRFEDLVRQLVYDFRPWLRLEATGRAGGDDGFDVRGIEAGDIVVEAPDGADDGNEDGHSTAEPVNERTWLVQCKREKEIGPTKLSKYLDEIDVEERKKLYGIIFVASADFSKASRDVMATWVRENGLLEFQIWSGSDIETMLMQPKNDHLLFAFFGISLQVRKRSVASALRSSIAMKRKVLKVFEKHQYGEFLIRDPDASGFPHATKGKRLKWIIRKHRGCDYRGIGFQLREFTAYANEAGEWDVANAHDEAIPRYDNPWLEYEPRTLSSEDRAELFRWTSEMDAAVRAELSVIAYIPFDQVIAVDEMGDNYLETSRDRPTFYIPITDEGVINLHNEEDISFRFLQSRTEIEFDEAKRVKFFPDKFRRMRLD
ncbi:restriction endonuclease [Bradyrhizobium sp. WSM1417]|uniref:restriction endonuclease n=1 Tax=Bradyrhizobium sp. WSM1417 TaxID=754500 RepID=UPI0006870337|nr:restriction endonuclease [Bradyrhizobium sp. WSM1417]